MTGSDRDRPVSPVPRSTERQPYARPQIAWREPYEPVSFGISCAKQPGNPPCIAGPTKS